MIKGAVAQGRALRATAQVGAMAKGAAAQAGAALTGTAQVEGLAYRIMRAWVVWS